MAVGDVSGDSVREGRGREGKWLGGGWVGGRERVKGKVGGLRWERAKLWSGWVCGMEAGKWVSEKYMYVVSEGNE